MVCAGGVKGEDSCQVRTKMVSQVLYREGECTTVDFKVTIIKQRYLKWIFQAFI